MQAKAWEHFNCYDVLHIHATASPQEIKIAYREACTRFHPDHGGSHEVMIKVNAAYEALADPVQRISHDLHWRVGAKADSNRRQASAGPQVRSTERARPATEREAEPPLKTRQREAVPLTTLRGRLHQRINEETEGIRNSFQTRVDKIASDIRERLASARRTLGYSFIIALVCTVIGTEIKPMLIGSILGTIWFLANAAGPTINGRRRSPFEPGRSWIKDEARRKATTECESEIAGLGRYESELASIIELVLRESTFDDSESQVARRITTAFFLLGYLPLEYSATDRLLAFNDGDEPVLVRFRHRSGPPLSVNYVQKLVDAMRVHHVSRGYVFCSPGLSGNAKSLADANNVRCYTLETMSHWIDEVLDGDYGGPTGDILKHIDALTAFLRKLSNVLPGRSPRSRRRRRRRRW